MGKVRSEYLAIDEQNAINCKCNAYLKDKTTGKCYAIPNGYWTIGRKDEEEEIDVDIPIETEDEFMSRHQARITLKQNIIGEYVLYICDTMQRSNPTRVDDYRIDSQYDYQVYDGSIIRMGYTEFEVHLKTTSH